jgi:hypothetical protein
MTMPKRPYNPPKLRSITLTPAEVARITDDPMRSVLADALQEVVGNFEPGKIFYDRDAYQLRRLPLILS